jgi:hypothetical protein
MTESIAPREAIDLYLKDRNPEVTESTYRNHKYHLRRFIEWCDETGFDDMSEMTGKQIYEYKIHRRDECGVLGADERDVQFGCWFKAEKAKIPSEWEASQEEPQWSSPSEVMWVVEDADIRHIEIGIEIHYEDGTGKRDPLILCTTEVDLRKCRDLRSALFWRARFREAMGRLE